jgi:hypothetical protein
MKPRRQYFANPRTTEPVMEAVKKTERLSPHPFQPSQERERETGAPKSYGVIA